MDTLRPTLVVVDMQPTFDAANDSKTLKNVARCISRAIKDKRPIVFLEYDGYGPTNNNLTCLCSGHNKVAVMKKCDDDGSREVIDACRERSFPTQYFEVCGVNTAYCVTETVLGLRNRCPKARVFVRKQACNGQADGHDPYEDCGRGQTFRYMRNTERVHIVGLRARLDKLAA